MSSLRNLESLITCIFNAGKFPANPHTKYMTSRTSVDLSFARGEFVILGTEYAGEMKKGVFTIMNYIMPKKGILSMHSSANVGKNGDVSLFFGLSGTGKTTLSADPNRSLIGDDEHCWTDDGIFNIEGGCYAKCIDLSEEKEPDIFHAIRYGTVLENVVFDSQSRRVDYADSSVTENTRASYPIEYIENSLVPCLGGHPDNILFLTCDAFGVLPPVSRLTSEQAMYHFISGYTAKVAGTERGITEPIATFSPCFGGPFLTLHPLKYAELLKEKIKTYGSKVFLVNTGWVGGSPSSGAKRISIGDTRKIIDSILLGSINEVSFNKDEIFGLMIPSSLDGVKSEILNPINAWSDKGLFINESKKLSDLFKKNFKKYGTEVEYLVSGGPL